MRLAVITGCAPLLLASCGQASVDQPAAHATQPDTLLLITRCETINQSQQCTLWGPSLVELIARPELYDGRPVRIVGFVNFEFEGNGIYLSSEDWERGSVRNGLWINPPPGFEADSGPAPKQPNRRYVIVEGTFNAHNRGHMGQWSGAIEKVTRLEPWGDWRSSRTRLPN